MSVHVEMLIEYDADIPCFARNLNLTVSYLKFVDMYTVRAKAGGDQDDLGFWSRLVLTYFESSIV